MDKKGRLIVISGPSGVGKTSLLKKLFSEYGDKIKFSVSHTSRQPRKGEINGVDYIFLTKEEFDKELKENLFLEYANVHDNYYGTSKEEVNKIMGQGYICLLDVDVQGGINLMGQKIEAQYIFIAPPSIETLRERLLKRSTDHIDVINKRVENAKKEIKYKDRYQYIVINDDFDTCYNDLVSVIFKISDKEIK